jgi:hypothetical protein
MKRCTINILDVPSRPGAVNISHHITSWLYHLQQNMLSLLYWRWGNIFLQNAGIHW